MNDTPTPLPLNVEIIKADYGLKHKIGPGPLEESVLEECQKVMDETTIDFRPAAIDLLDKLQNTLAQYRANNISDASALEAMQNTIMDLKANPPFFKYTLVGDLANIMLGLLESVVKLDDDVIEIITAHHTTLSLIIKQNITGTGGEKGRIIKAELINACNRYYNLKKS
jgi:hypothetical protein